MHHVRTDHRSGFDGTSPGKHRSACPSTEAKDYAIKTDVVPPHKSMLVSLRSQALADHRSGVDKRPFDELDPHEGDVTDPSCNGAGRDPSHWPSHTVGQPQEHNEWGGRIKQDSSDDNSAKWQECVRAQAWRQGDNDDGPGGHDNEVEARPHGQNNDRTSEGRPGGHDDGPGAHDNEVNARPCGHENHENENNRWPGVHIDGPGGHDNEDEARQAANE